MPPPRYPGWACNPDFGEEPMPGVVTVSSAGLIFESDAAVRIELSLERIQLDRDPDSRLLITDPMQPDWVVALAQDRVLDNYFLRHNNAARAEIRRYRQSLESSRSLRLSVWFLVVVAGAVFFLAMGGRIAGAIVAARISPAYEIQLGQEVLDQLELTLEKSPKDVAWLQTLLDRVAAGLPPSDRDRYAWRVMLIHNPFPNAAAVPGGTVLVTSGLLSQLPESEEIAAVLAHEVAHITHRHGLRSLIRILGPYYALQIFTLDRHDFLRAAGGAALIVSHQFYSRKQELEADDSAWDLLVRARVDPRALPRALGRLSSAEASTRSLETPRFLLSHPPDEERIARLEGFWARKPASGPFAPLPSRP
jgi:beta-barrel assembly-enhancing protease